MARSGDGGEGRASSRSRDAASGVRGTLGPGASLWSAAGARRADASLRRGILVLFLLAVSFTLGSEVRAEVTGSPSLVARCRPVAEAVARVRGLEWRRPVCCRLVSREQLVERLRRHVEARYTPDMLEREGRMLALLGVLDHGDRYAARVFARIGEGINGFYESESRCLYLDRGQSGEAQQETMAHELTHALQDQHFDLTTLLRPRPGMSDAQVAASALAEGDATVVARALRANLTDALRGQRWLSALRGLFLPPRRREEGGIDGYLRRSGRFAYVRGAAMVRAAHARGGWRRVDALFRRPPLSTAEVTAIGEGRSFRGAPARFEPPESIPAGCRFVGTETLGQQLIIQVLERWSGSADGPRGLGWRGDHALIYEGCGGEAGTAAIARIVFGSRESAARARAALLSANRRRSRHGSEERSSCFTVARGGADVVISAGFGCRASAELVGEVSAASGSTSDPAAR